jgi:NADH-quinone oxidoreductase subunit L
MVELVWLIPMLPLVGFVALLLLGKRLGDPWAGWLATAMVVASFVTACVVFAGLLGQPENTYEHSYFTWIPAGSFQVEFNTLLDPMSMAMVLFITGISSLIHLYSIGYMHGDEKYWKFFLYLNLFVFSMLVLVLGGNLLLTFLGWEGVGTCSYFLISFWFGKEANASAGKKAFVTNRVGDWGFMVAMFFVFLTFGTLNYNEFLPAAASGSVAQTTVTIIAVMLFVGAIGKSAQIPLYIWLPDAMAGPTPVSALIHAATMVTAGVYLMCRISPVIAVSADWVPMLIAWTGAITALVAATIATAQMDIKKVLAYSTVSQLGYMFLAVGVGAYWVAIFHMITHAFFKACMFLGSGSVIHGMHDEQDMRRMGNLKKYMPITAITFMCGWLAIAGIPPFSGFWSKDEILAYALHANPALYAVGLFAALLTAYYMSRAVFRTFYGDEKWRVVPVPADDQTLADAVAAAPDEEREAALAAVPDLVLAFDPEPPHGHIDAEYEPHESAWTMTLPLVVLGFFSVVAGFLNIPFGSLHFLEDWLEPVFVLSDPAELHATTTQTLIELGVGAAVGIVGCFLGYALWRSTRRDQGRFELPFFGNGWYYDITITRLMGGPGRIAADAMAWFDRTVIDGAVNGIGVVTVESSTLLRRMQSGYLRRYALALAFGSAVLLVFIASRVVNL